MKTKRNLFLFIAAALTNLTATAQQQEDKDFLPDGIVTVEWRFNPFDYEEKPKNMAQLNARMFLNGKSAIRLGVGFGFHRDKDDQKNSKDTRCQDANNYDIINGETSIINKETSLKVAAGYEYHFAATGHLDFYVGAEAGYLGRFYSATKETATNTTNAKTMSGKLSLTRTSEYDNYKYSKSNADRTKFNENGFFGTLLAGVDFYVYRKLYIGAELGITFNTGKKANGTYSRQNGKVIVSGASTTANWVDTYSSDTGLTVHVDNINSKNNKTTADFVYDNTGTYTKIYIEPAIRIGWMF